ncbi:MAG: subclass B3 metallo-beta-lactamase [Acidobacteria bacterium]|nr:subclass B3 metallo-beta-lactamase [Acidobacteriota bacterium]
MSKLLMIALPLLAFAANPPEWSRPFPPHRIAGHIYYVGTEDLGCYLITGKAGHILLNTGLEDSPAMIASSIEKLGFKLSDIKILLTNQAHFDHVAGLADMQKMTGAKVYATPPDAKLIESGGKADPSGFTNYKPTKVDRILNNGDIIRLGEIRLKTIHHFGHTPGSSSYETTVVENGKQLSFLMVNMGSVVMPLTSPGYPAIVTDFRATFAHQKTLHPDIWVATHGSQYNLKEKFRSKNFADAAGYQEAVVSFEKTFERQVKIELGQ